MKYRIASMVISVLLLCLTSLPEALADTDHSFITTYEGSKTCRPCHDGSG